MYNFYCAVIFTMASLIFLKFIDSPKKKKNENILNETFFLEIKKFIRYTLRAII